MKFKIRLIHLKAVLFSQEHFFFVFCSFINSNDRHNSSRFISLLSL